MFKGKKFKKIFKIVAATMLVAVLPLFATYSSIMSQLGTSNPMVKDGNYTSYYKVSYKKAIKKSRESVVRIVSLDGRGSGYFSTATGTYFQAYGGYFVITVMHAIQGPCELTTIVHEDEVYDCKKYIATDLQNDYAIIQIEEILNRTAIDIFKDLPRHNQWKKSYSLMNRLVYTGYPNTIGPLTISGDVAGFAGLDYIYMLSYAWAGSSGSGVFDQRGKYIGYVVAVDVGQTEFGAQVLQNVVLVAPAFNVDWTKVITDAE